MENKNSVKQEAPGCYWLGSQVTNEQISKFITCMAGTPPRIFKFMKATGIVKSWWIPATKQLPLEVATISAEDFQVDTHLFLGRFLSISSQKCKLQVRLALTILLVLVGWYVDVNKETIYIADVSTLQSRHSQHHLHPPRQSWPRKALRPRSSHAAWVFPWSSRRSSWRQPDSRSPLHPVGISGHFFHTIQIILEKKSESDSQGTTSLI